MKSIKYLKLALFALVIGLSATSCMDEDWTDPTMSFLLLTLRQSTVHN